MKPNSPLFALIPFVSLAVASPLTWGSTQIPLGGVSNGQFGTDFKVPTAPPNSGCHMSKAAQLAAQLATDSMDAVIETHFELGKEEFEQNRQGLYKDMHLNLDELRLIQLEGQEPIWVSEWDKIKMKAKGINFFDITDTPFFPPASLRPQTPVPTTLNKKTSKKVKSVIEELDKDNLRANLEHFSGFKTRYYRSDYGKQSQQWLLAKIEELTKKHASKDLAPHIGIGDFKHSWGQNSIIVSINGSTHPDEVVVIGAHQDSTNMFPWLGAPGADDDGSGSVTILEAYRGLISSGFKPNRTVEFHWYSAEEGGLLGSAAVSKDYAARGVNVVGMSQFDMTAWVKAGTKESVGIITDFVDPDLTEFNKKLVDEYLDIPYVLTKCGYACSDHASWNKAGYKSIFTIESTMENSNKNIHSTSDRIDISPEFSFDHMFEFTKLAVAFASELGKW